ncbi:MAG: glycosyltransferase family 4 protein [Verrucomicrobia bacterium]|nr:glycosyltransferase family 4 protein [Verrucomicrobiota bacterium]
MARLKSAGEVLGPMGWRVVALETAGKDATYAWERMESVGQDFERRTVFKDRVFEEISASEVKRGIFQELDKIQPQAVVIAGWGTADARACLAWCKKNGAKAIVMSETRAADGRRVWWKEWIKSRLVRKFDGALCGGESHKRYLIKLGIPAERIAAGYNVVDNALFFNKAKRDREVFQSSVGEAKSASYFLASNRFVKRKNLERLIQAYAKYAESFHQGGVENIWPLVLLGDGELRGDLLALCGDLGLQFANSGQAGNLKLNSYKLKTSKEFGLVVFSGFRQIEELPGFYAGAGAFVHPALEEPWGLVINEAMASGLPVLSSRNVGAAEELVVDGETGYLFDPMNIEEMANAMSKVAGMNQEERLTMGRAAYEMVERKAPVKAFGEGLAKLLMGKL